MTQWNPTQLNVARALACSHTHEQAADLAHCSRSTVERLVRRSAFHDLIEEYRKAVWREVEPAFLANLILALDLQRQVIRGDVDATEPRAEGDISHAGGARGRRGLTAAAGGTTALADVVEHFPEELIEPDVQHDGDGVERPHGGVRLPPLDAADPGRVVAALRGQGLL